MGAAAGWLAGGPATKGTAGAQFPVVGALGVVAGAPGAGTLQAGVMGATGAPCAGAAGALRAGTLATGAPATPAARYGEPRAGICGWDDPLHAARRTWWLVTLLLNAAMLPLGLAGRATEASLAAVLIAVLARHDGLISAVGRRIGARPAYRAHQLLNHLGQLHRAMALAAIGWLALATSQQPVRPTVAGILIGLVAALLVMAWSARDAVRPTRHERFELIHRFVGWSALMVLIALVAHRFAVAAATGRLGEAVPSVLLLAGVVGVVAQPWLSVRRLPVEVLDVTPGLVILALPGRRRVGDFVRVSIEGREWHAFAVSSCGREGSDRFCLVIRRAGDWTERLGRSCDEGRPPTSLLIRTMRGYGFMGNARAYREVLVIATGAGIGPVLLYLLDRPQPGLRCLWVARDHRSSIGADLVDRVLAGGQTTLIDSTIARPDLGRLVAAAAPRTGAVFVVGNPGVRDRVAAACADLGMRWYGPTFDS